MHSFFDVLVKVPAESLCGTLFCRPLDLFITHALADKIPSVRQSDKSGAEEGWSLLFDFVKENADAIEKELRTSKPIYCGKGKANWRLLLM